MPFADKSEYMVAFLPTLPCPCVVPGVFSIKRIWRSNVTQHRLRAGDDFDVPASIEPYEYSACFSV